MKQYITPDQLNELTEEQKKKLPTKWIHEDHDRDSDSWCYSCRESVSPEDKTQYAPALLSIGQMIEFLDEQDCTHKERYIDEERYKHIIEGFIQPTQYAFGIGWDNELCDALWEAVKEKVQ